MLYYNNMIKLVLFSQSLLLTLLILVLKLNFLCMINYRVFSVFELWKKRFLFFLLHFLPVCVDRMRPLMTKSKTLRNNGNYNKVIRTYRRRCRVRTVWPLSYRLCHLWAGWCSCSEKEMLRTIRYIKFLRKKIK